MSPRNQFFLTVAVLALILGIALVTSLRRYEEPVQVFPATIDRDCAPWDGAAFTVSIPLDKGSLQISIYRSPRAQAAGDIHLPGRNPDGM